MNIIGEVRDKDVIILDDMIDTAGTLCNGAQSHQGGRRAQRCGGGDPRGALRPALERIQNSVLEEIVLLDTIHLPEEKKLDRIKTLSVAPVLAEAIARIYSDKPVSTLFV